MRESRLIMGMPVSVEIRDLPEDPKIAADIFKKVFEYFEWVDQKFSTYKPESEISRYNRGEVKEIELSSEMQEIFKLAEQTKSATSGYFDIRKPDNSIDPSGLVKGWAISNAAKIILEKGFQDFFVEAGGDIEAHLPESAEVPWSIGIRNPFNREENVKILKIFRAGVATSGNYIRGDHIYNPLSPDKKPDGVASITVIGENAYEADRFATAAFAMGKAGVLFIEKLPGFEAYQIDSSGIATMTSGFNKYL